MVDVENLEFSGEEFKKERILARRITARFVEIKQSLEDKDRHKRNKTVGRPPDHSGQEFCLAVKNAKKQKRDVGIGNVKVIAQVARSVTRENCKSEFKKIWPAFGDPKTSPKLSMIEHLKFGREFFALVLNGYYQANIKTKKAPASNPSTRKSSKKEPQQHLPSFFPSELMDLYTRIFIEYMKTGGQAIDLEAAVKEDIAFMEKLTEKFMEEYDQNDKQNVKPSAAIFDEVISKELDNFDEASNQKLSKVNVNRGASQKEPKDREIQVADYFRAWLIILYHTFSSLDWVIPKRLTNHITLQYFWKNIRELKKEEDDNRKEGDGGDKEKETAEDSEDVKDNGERNPWTVGLELFFAVILLAHKQKNYETSFATTLIHSRNMARNNILNVSQKAMVKMDVCAVLQVLSVEYFTSVAFQQYVKIEKSFDESKFEKSDYEFFGKIKVALDSIFSKKSDEEEQGDDGSNEESSQTKKSDEEEESRHDDCNEKPQTEDAASSMRRFLGYEYFHKILLINGNKSKGRKGELETTIVSNGDENSKRRWSLLVAYLKDVCPQTKRQRFERLLDDLKLKEEGDSEAVL